MRWTDLNLTPCHYLLVCSILLLPACAATKQYDLGPLPVATSQDFVVIDSRPDAAKSYKTGCGYRQPVDTVGDDNFRPHRMDLLKATFQHRLGTYLAGQTIEITRFDTFIIYPFSCGRSMGGGIAAVSLPAAIGYRSGAAAGRDSIATYIEGKVAGIDFKGHALVPVQPVIPLMGGWNVRNQDIRASIEQALNRAADNIIE